MLFQQSLLDAGKEVNDALAQWQTARKQIAIGEQRIAALQEAVRKNRTADAPFSTNYLEVLTAQQSLLDAQQVQSQNRFDEIQGVINAYHAVGEEYNYQ